MQITYKFRLYPTPEQEQKLLWTLEKCRLVYNDMLEGLNGQAQPNKLELQSTLPKLKEKYPELKEVYSKVLQYEVYRLFSNLKALAQLKKKGKKVGRLRFKGKGWFKTFTYNQSGFELIKTVKRLDRLHLSKIGDVPIRIPRELEGSIKQIVIKKRNSGKWYACVSVEAGNKPEQKPIQEAVGLDVGVEHFTTDSDGKQIENPHHLKKTLKRLKRRQKKLSRTEKDSNRRNKQRIIVASLHERVTSQRDDFLHKLSRYYVDRYDFIAVEDLNIRGMVRNHKLSSSISDVAWNKFTQMLAYKAGNAGKVVVRVNPRNTTQRCSRCGGIVKKGLAERTHKCPSCGLELDRDYNSAIDILKSGLEKLPQGLREFTPVEIGPLRELEPIPASSIVEAGSHLPEIR
jgi:putative transposase